jgi:hypothetical protein
LKFTIIAPLHNEEKMLPYTLGSIYDLQPSEVLFGLDRCNDATEFIITSEAKLHPDTQTRIIHFKESDGGGWNFRPGYLRRCLYKYAQNDVILNTSADLRLDPKIGNYLKLIPLNNYGLLSFGYYDYPWNSQSFVKRIISETLPLHGFAGLLALSKNAWLRCEDLEDLRTQPKIMGEDTHLHYAIRRKYPTKHINTCSLHLRPNESAEDHYKYGVVEWSLFHRSPVKALAYAAVMLRPLSLTGYVDARRHTHDL